ncbi:MAG: PQQ-binding-like beta-propeller repeat protein [Cyclobacteriaceae bacterium]|nr:PQQ-binding-like beta-propeller repeat protein [Cyclobacteriaceae bacterium]
MLGNILPLRVLNAQESWQKQIPGVGTFSSPRIADLNEDGTGDIILGAGREEFNACDTAIFALDGKTGEFLWHVPSRDQIFGSATLKDITGDGIMDVFIGGRSAELQAINGKTGEVIWSFVEVHKPRKGKKKEWYNFYNPQFIPDQTGDGLEDILVSNGGDVLAEPYDPDRPAGNLVVLDSKTGQILARAQVPDGKEIYLSVSSVPTEDGHDRKVVFGTGGETIGGNLYVVLLSEIMNGDLSGSVKLATGESKGFIGPPAWVDITDDGYPDIIANAVDGRLLAFNGKTYETIWQVEMPGTEAYSSIATGFFNKDSIPDIFVSYAQGSWPNLDWTKQFMVNGADGKIEFMDSLGFYQTSTPVIADLNLDGTDDALLVVNYQVIDDLYRKWFYNMLVGIDFVKNEIIELGINQPGYNNASTPWIGDLDNDGKIDIIYCHGTNSRHTNTFDGIQVNRIVTSIPIRRTIRWGAYMGSNYDGVFNKLMP